MSGHKEPYAASVNNGSEQNEGEGQRQGQAQLELLVRSLITGFSETEWAILTTMSQLKATHKTNLVRRGLKGQAEEMGMDLPPGAFEDRTSGNRLPKSKKQVRPS